MTKSKEWRGDKLKRQRVEKRQSALSTPEDAGLTIQEVEECGTPIGQLQDGAWFAFWGQITEEPPTCGTVIGEVVHIGVGSVLVQLNRSWFHRGYWAPETKVVPLPKPESVSGAEVTEVATLTKETAQEVGASNAEGKRLQAIYNFQHKQLNKAMDAEDAAALNKAAAAISRIEAEAKGKGIELAKQGAVAVAEQEEEQVAAPAKQPKSVVDKNKVADKAAKLAAAKKEAPVAGATKAAKPKKEKVLRPCLEGCGEMVGGNFKMGHDAKLKSLIIKIEKGEEEKDALPEIVQGIVKFKKGDVEEEKDAKGKTISKTQLYVCTAAPVRFPGRPEIEFTEREAD